MAPTAASATHHESTLRDYLHILKRRKWMVLQGLVLLPLVAVAVSLQQQKLYEATAEVLLSRQNLASSLTGTQDPTAYVQADRLAQTQAELAEVPEVARRTLRAVGLSDEPKEFLEQSSVSAKQNADLLVFKVTHSDPALARRLASAYAAEFTAYRRELDTASLARARREVTERIEELEARGERRTELYTSLVDKEQQLRTMEALQTSNAFVVRAAEEAVQVQPRPVRNAILGIAVGLILGLGLAFLWEALDTRIRSAEEIGERLGLPLLARLPEPPRRLRNSNKLVMLAQPTGTHSEAFRVLRTNLEFAVLGKEVQTIMVTSAVQQEGKSTTVANLAVALARSGNRVILVDLDLRRPYVDRFFPLDGHPGLTQVALGHARLAKALAPVPLTGAAGANGKVERRGRRDVKKSIKTAENGAAISEGSLHVLATGPVPPNAGEFVATDALTEILGSLREQADVVLIDAPPLLQVGDALTLSAKVDAILVVARLKIVSRPMIGELRRLLERTPAHKLGFVLTAADGSDVYGYGGSYYYSSYHREREPVA